MPPCGPVARLDKQGAEANAGAVGGANSDGALPPASAVTAVVARMDKGWVGGYCTVGANEERLLCAGGAGGLYNIDGGTGVVKAGTVVCGSPGGAVSDGPLLPVGLWNKKKGRAEEEEEAEAEIVAGVPGPGTCMGGRGGGIDSGGWATGACCRGRGGG